MRPKTVRADMTLRPTPPSPCPPPRRRLTLLVGLSLAVACLLPNQSWAGKGPEPAAAPAAEAAGPAPLALDLGRMSREVAGKVFYQLKADGHEDSSARLAVVCAVPLSDLKRETEFGRMVAEYYLTDLADRGLKVRELRLGKDINILPQAGEFILSQNLGELATDAPELDYVVVSTFTNTRNTLILQGRLVSLQNGLVSSSWRYTFPLTRDLTTLLSDHPRPCTIAVKGFAGGQQN
ncbi:MAG: FlgO family outer membrane protein [Desulfobacteraceae bacterium]|nr:FlgO family outer membrane protein [Desulfobacteraceae bacterium]